MRDLLRTHDEQRDVQHARHRRDDSNARKASDVPEESHGDYRTLDAAEAFPQDEGYNGDGTRYQETENLG